MALKLKNPVPKVVAPQGPTPAQIMQETLRKSAQQNAQAQRVAAANPPVQPKSSAWDRFKRAASYDVTKPVKEKAQAAKQYVGDVTDKYTPTLKKVPGAVGKGIKGAGKAVAAGAGYVAGRLTSKGSGITGGGLSGERGSLWWIFIAILLYLSDIFITSFNGFNFQSLINTFSVMNVKSITSIFLNAGIITIMVAYAIFKKPDKREFFSFLILAELIWLIISMGISFGSIAHIVFAIFVLIWLVYPVMEDKTQANFLIVLCILVDFFLFSAIAKYAPNLPYFNRLIIPIWFFVALAFTRESKPKKFLVFIVIMLYVLNAYAVVGEFRNVATASITQKEINTVKDFFGKIWENIKSIPDNIISAQQKLEQEALGEYYTGNIDQNAKERLGVYIEDIKAADQFVYENQPATIWGTLIVKTIDEPINIKIGCIEKIDNELKNVINAEVYPKDNFSIDMSEEEGIECTFPNGSLSESNHEIGIKADFNFLTMAYIKTYFMDKEAKRALSSQSIDPLDYYKIVDKTPAAIYTAGPVNIGIDVGKPPLTTDMEFRLGLQLTNIWEGKLNEVTDLYIIMPNSIEMSNQRSDGYHCSGKNDYLFLKSSCQEIGEQEQGCTDNNHNVFKLASTSPKIKNIESFEPLLCRLKILNPAALLGEVPVSTRYFKVVAKYNYTIHKEIGIEVRGGDGIKTYFNETQCSETCNDKDGCICPTGCNVKENTLIGKTADCGKQKGDGIKTNLTDCYTNCTDIDGCICPNNCNIPVDINYNSGCGGIKETDYSSGSGTCSQDGWKIICDECSNAKDQNENLLYNGIFCVNTKWVCTVDANSEDSTYHTLEECPHDK